MYLIIHLKIFTKIQLIDAEEELPNHSSQTIFHFYFVFRFTSLETKEKYRLWK